MAYKTPGVYVEEISTLPPSVAEVETAIPAFIGYTDKPGQLADGLPVPVRISSMLEYETIFGKAKDQTGIAASIVNGVITSFTPPSAANLKFLMYYSLQMYFANGGGPCYIASVGTYAANTVTLAALQDGLKSIGKEDEPTLLLFPDATSLSTATDFYTIYKDALAQCNKLQDRFTIVDTYTDGTITPTTGPIADLRTGIGTDYLKYGAAYYPFLSTTLNYQYLDSEVAVGVTTPGVDYDGQASAILAGVSTTDLTTEIGDLYAEVEAINMSPTPEPAAVTALPDLIGWVGNIITELTTIKNSYTAGAAIGTAAYAAHPTASAVNAAVIALENWAEDELTTQIDAMDDILEALEVTSPAPPTGAEIINLMADVYSTLGITGSSTSAIVTEINNGGHSMFEALIDALEPISGGLDGETLEWLKTENNLLYNEIKASIAQFTIKLPPSASIAGVYARVDNNSGVWTAPANVSLNYVIAPTKLIDNAMQDDMNVTSSGKSVNAIRAFTGKGILVWGARTLAGNDNEWRYVPVRRFFNFAEESIRKGTESFVFQPNDTNTWVKVRAMSEAFLTQQWKAGALTGGKTEQAFYVRVGLGQTMTAQDILEGRMIVEVGMAVVRPAEFIILRFTHMMQEA